MKTLDNPSERSWRVRVRRDCRERIQPVWEYYQWWIVGSMWALAFILGYIGFAKRSADAGDARSVLDAAYRALQLFLFQGGEFSAALKFNWSLEIARWLAPAVAAYTAFTAFAALLREQLHLVRLRRISGHVVICGLTEEGLEMAKDFQSKGERVVVIEKDEDQEDIPVCRDDGIIVLIGDATDESVLRNARIERAKSLIAICGDDGTNVEIAAQAHEILRVAPSNELPTFSKHAREADQLQGTTRRLRRGLDCLVHIVDLKLRSLVERSRIYTQLDDRLRVRFFNIFESGAQALLQEYPPDLRMSGQTNRPVHMLVIGFGETGESIVLQAAKLLGRESLQISDANRGHEPTPSPLPGGEHATGAANETPLLGGAGGGFMESGDKQRLRITVIDREADRKQVLFRLDYPEFGQFCDLRFISMDVEGPEFVEGKFLWQEDRPGCVSAIYVCLDSDSRSLSSALKLLLKVKGQPTRIVACMKENAGLAVMLQNMDPEFAKTQQIYAFGILDAACRRENILNDSPDRLVSQ